MLGAAIAFAGEVALIATASSRVPSPTGVTTSILGDVLVLGSCVSVATSFVAGARLTPHIGSWAATFWAIVLASIALAPLAVIEAGQVAWTALMPSSWMALLHLAFGAGVVGFVSWFWALARGGIAQVSVLQFFQPLVSLAFATFLLAESLTAPMLLAASAIFAGVALARRSQAERADSTSRGAMASRAA
jgi:drug/metabolite transporter (DMT)-like permease